MTTINPTTKKNKKYSLFLQYEILEKMVTYIGTIFFFPIGLQEFRGKNNSIVSMNNLYKNRKQAMITLRGMADKRFTNVCYPTASFSCIVPIKLLLYKRN